MIDASRLTFFLLLVTISGWAICPEPDTPVCSEYFNAEQIVVGRVKSTTSVPAQEGHDDGFLYGFQVTRVLKGETANRITVFTENNNAGFRMEPEHEYLLFLSWDEQNRLAVSGCGNSRELSDAGSVLSKIEALKTQRVSSQIMGRVVAGKDSDEPVRDVHVSIAGTQQYSAITDRKGWFHVHVRPGTYKVKVSAKGWRFSPAWLVNDDPDDVTIEQAGQCAVVQFDGTHQ